MPTYQYACTVCEHRFEAVQAFTDAALTVCPECGERLRKLYGSVGVVFKGSGFYRTDSRDSTKKKSESSSTVSSESSATTTTKPSSESSTGTSSSTSTTSSTPSSSTSTTTSAAKAS